MTSAEHGILGMKTGVARWVLLISLVLNFLVIGAYVGLTMRDDTRARSSSVINQITVVVGEDRKEQVSEILRERRKGWRQRRNQRTDDWSAIADYVASDDFTSEGFAAMLNEQGALSESGRKESRSAFARAVSVLNAEERAEYAKIIRAFVAKRSDNQGR